jgi:hypothetical protein
VCFPMRKKGLGAMTLPQAAWETPPGGLWGELTGHRSTGSVRLTKARGMIIRAWGIVPVKARDHVDQSTGSKADQSTGYGNQSTGYSAGQKKARDHNQSMGLCLPKHGV